ncbi:type I-C CRISPR-associated protein Cas8c/Csd1 [Laedolimicola ammoniilytica]|uniref:Type I-C CRISPR-associated protein Cas8c/Csd1 n=1 Tax=Laedolimicola ammoniilytica TaxID=2981771 RepID=A0ABT2RZF8_9FIRM|nr:type I-C CRISPR-associated protein Cas8c/Csd1 [Laedolimicola ammoniilytica]MCU6697597.1 type I-C CRISPR-associated protein Cas8c/Csd1 [Laedolimicola ammoniilytica]SCI35523.1 CRISPR-associated protein Cas8c/Csd1%2C subtype I-C/DVULG [uncultured Clostridium sp.]
MILQALVKQYENLERQGKVSGLGWCQAKVSYELDLSKNGDVLGVTSRKIEEMRGKKTVWAPASLIVPEMVTRSSGVSANFLCDNSKYMLGIDVQGTNQRVIDCFQATREKHRSVLKNAQGEIARAILAYFEKWDPQKAEQHPVIRENWEKLTEGGNLIFSVEGQEAQEDEEIRTCWEQYREQDDGERKGLCLVTGRKTEISRIHKVIKGVPGAQSSGAALVSFNAPAFESYGKEQSYNAPVGKYAEFAYTTALNYLLTQRDYTFSLGDAMVVYWAESGKEEYQKCFFDILRPTKDNQKKLKDIFDSLKEDTKVYLENAEMDPEQKFYILALAPNAARLSVRFFYMNSFGKILQNIAEHYERLSIVKPAWAEQDYLGIRDMLNETVNQKSKDKTPISNMSSLVLQAILSGSRYPASLYTDTLIRIRAENGKITWGRAAIIKAYLNRNYGWKKGERFMGLKEECTDTAYVLGRLFSLLEAIQKEANPSITTTIRDRYFNSACATPASVFPVLIKLKNSHIKKLERDKGGAKIYYEKQLTDIMGRLEEFPKRLSLEQQGQFTLGYYHQQQKRYEKGEEK